MRVNIEFTKHFKKLSKTYRFFDKWQQIDSPYFHIHVLLSRHLKKYFLAMELGDLLGQGQLHFSTQPIDGWIVYQQESTVLCRGL